MAESPTQRGRLIVLAAPSGAGKTSLVRALLQRAPNLEFSVSYTTRQPRSSETAGVDYRFVDEQEFTRMVDEDEFLEFAQVFDHRYGTGRRQVERRLAQGRSVLLEIDWQGARQVRRKAPDAIFVFILPPSVEELERRLRGRGTDSEATIQRRLRDAVSDMQHWREFDYVLINRDLERTTADLEAIVDGRGERHRSDSPALIAEIDSILGR